MNRRGSLEDRIVILLPILVLLAQVSFIDAGASSNPKNLVNLYSNSQNDNLNSTSLNQFQNEYQYRQVASKSASSDKHKSSHQSNTGSIFDHLSSDLNNLGLFDYSYQDSRSPTNLPECKGRVKLNGTRGFITDGAGYYETNLQCTWLIDSGRDNTTIRLQFHQFNTECSYDYLYVFDGDSIYSPLVAALSGDMKDFSMTANEPRLENAISNRTDSASNKTSIYSSNNAISHGSIFGSRPFELKTNSGKVFIYFHSDTAQRMPGFYVTYSINSCSLDCSNRGECDYSNLICKCNPGYYGDGCEHISCPNNCTSPLHGICENERSCICKEGFLGPDCSNKSVQQFWSNQEGIQDNVLARAFHQATVVDGLMWVLGGRTSTFSNSNIDIYRRRKTLMVSSFEIESKKWTSTALYGTTGIDHLAEITGHSVAAKGHKIFIYGGIALNNTILDTLTVLDTKTYSLISLPDGKTGETLENAFIAPLAVTGHTANIIDGYMFVFLGYNPIYGYINLVQKFNLANNTWSFIDQKGSSIEGMIGHSSSYDPVDRLVYLYGGHDVHASKKLYSFNPYLEVWTFLQAGPNHRYYHSSTILGKQLLIIGGTSYLTSRQSDQCFQQSYSTYDLTCSRSNPDYLELTSNLTVSQYVGCGSKCWQVLDDPEPSILKRHGHSVVHHNNDLILFGGFNGVLQGDIRIMKLGTCDSFHRESDCNEPKLALSCSWNVIEMKCEDNSQRVPRVASPVGTDSSNSNCTKNEIKNLQHACEGRETCIDCLNTNLGCVWCGFLSQCHYSRCKSSTSKPITDSNSCYKDEYIKSSLFGSHLIKDFPVTQDLDHETECKRQNNCYICHAKPYCNWQNGGCTSILPNVISNPSTNPLLPDEMNDVFNSNSIIPRQSNSSRSMQRLEPLNRSNLAAFTTSLLNHPRHTCESPCFKRHSCNECTSTKCIWCSTSEQCIDSTAYFAYHAMGQCMHYVAHTSKCSTASCSDIESCDKCLTNPKCGWLNDISNTGKGRCIEGTSDGPSLIGDSSVSISGESRSTSPIPPNLLNWYFSSCPSCQCNGHSSCKPNSSFCVPYCQDNTEGAHCERCIPGYYGDPINGGTCLPCRCNGHAQYCNRETGKCYCSTKGIIGHNCNKCDDQNHYIGDPSSLTNGTCYYNLTTDYQYTFNMSKPEDFHYSDINFINVPLRKDSDVDFTIACSRLALVNITAGTSYNNRKIIHSGLECGTFRLRFPHDRHILTEANYSFFVHVFKFQTPFILQIAFSQHRTLYLPQFFFTFSR